MGVSDEFALSEEELRAIARFSHAAASSVLPVFEGHSPEDGRPRAALEACRRFASGEPRSVLQRRTSMDAHRAAWATSEEGPRLAAQAAGDAAAAAYMHPIAQATQVAHILRAAANAARIAEIAADDDRRAGERAVAEWASAAEPTVAMVLRRYPPAPSGRSRAAELMVLLDEALRAH